MQDFNGGIIMIYLNVIFIVIAVLCIVYAIFRPMDVLSWWWVKSKAAVLGIFNWLKGLTK